MKVDTSASEIAELLYVHDNKDVNKRKKKKRPIGVRIN